MKVCVIGLGSMGKRRVRDLTALGTAVGGVDPAPARREEAHQAYAIRTWARTEDALADSPPDAVVISTPPDTHTIYGSIAARAGLPFFMEASVVGEGLTELASICRTRGILAAPSCTMRFHPSVATLKEIVADLSPASFASFSYVSGQYLPDWHPWEDYRRFYAARKETGACREIVPYELVWLTWLFGDVAKVAALKAKRTALETEIDDLYLLLLAFSTGVVGTLEANVISRIPERSFRAIGELHHLIWHWRQNEVRLFDAAAGTWRVYPTAHGFAAFNLEEMYRREMEAFLQAVRGETSFGYTLEDDLRILRVLQTAEETSIL